MSTIRSSGCWRSSLNARMMPACAAGSRSVMQKLPGYNPEHNDWVFGKFQPDGTVDAYGRAQGCQNCHMSAPNGYVYTPVQ